MKQITLAVLTALACTSAFAAEPWENPEKNCPPNAAELNRLNELIARDVNAPQWEQDMQRGVLNNERASCKEYFAVHGATIVYENNLVADYERRKKLPGARIGMSAKTVLEKTSWGPPDDVNKTITRAGVREQWVYDSGYLYFENGVLTTIQVRQ